MRKYYFLLPCILFWSVSGLIAQNPYINHYTTQDGLPSNTIYHIFQDSKKFIWFATDAGVSKYDGTIFTNFRKKDGLASNEVICIKEDLFGRIWFFHYNGALSYIFQNKIHSETNTPFLKSIEGKEFYFNFLQDSDSTICFYNRFCEIITLDKHNSIKRYDLYAKLFQAVSGLAEEPAGLYLRQLTKSVSGEFLFWTGCGLIRQKTF